jgi:hypothetical protein
MLGRSPDWLIDHCVVVRKVFSLYSPRPHVLTRNELIKLALFDAIMGICVCWISRHVVFVKRCTFITYTVGNFLQVAICMMGMPHVYCGFKLE